MMNLSQRDRVIPSVMIALAAIIACAALVYWFFVPPPTTAGVAQSHMRARDRIFATIDSAKAQARTTVATVSPHLGDADQEGATSFVLAVLTNQAQRHSLRLTAFRPERPQPLGSITELRYTVQITGSYGAVHDALAALDGNKRLVLRSIQIASAEQSSGAVTALVGLSAYMPVDPQLVADISTPAAPAPAARSSLRAASRAAQPQTGGAHG